MITLVYQLEARLNADVTKGREELRLLFRGGRIDLLPQPEASTSHDPSRSRYRF